ncbi:putative reverse transcriptase domain-containing protein [Tanacetum coccineum]
MVWFNSCIPRHAFNLWLIVKRKLNTQDMIRAWDVSDSLGTSYALCEMMPDSHKHLFFDCTFSQAVWSHMVRLTGFNLASHDIYSLISSLQPDVKRRTTKSVIVRLVIAASAYFVWQERNWRLFKSKKRTVVPYGMSYEFWLFKLLLEEVIKHEISEILVTYTSVSFPVEDDSDIGSPGVDGPPIMPEDPYAYIMAAYEVPPSPDYIPGLEVPPSPDYIPGPEVPPSPDYLLAVRFHIGGYYLAPEEPAVTSPWDDDDDKDEDEEEEEEHPALADSVPPIHYMTARISIRDEPSISLPPREEASCLNHPTTITTYSTIISITIDTITNTHSPTYIEIPESCLPLRKRVCFASPTPSHEDGESSAASAARQDRPTIARDDPYSIEREELDYDITDTWDDMVGAIDEIAPTTIEGVNQRVTDLATIVEEETTSMYDDGSEAWGLSKDASDYANVQMFMSLRTTGSGRRDHKRQVQLTKTLKLLKGLHTQMVEFQRQHRPAEGPSQPDAPGEAGLPQLGSFFLFRNGTKRKRTTRLNPDATPTPVTDTHTTTSVTNAQIQAMINEGVTAALAARDATRNG